MNAYDLDEETDTRIVLFLLKNVKDLKTFKSKIISGEVDCCALKPSLILNSFHILIAANRSAISKKRGTLITKSLNTELLYNLSTSKNISQALTRFGIDDQNPNVVVVVFEENGDNKFERLKNYFQGEIRGIEENQPDVDLIKKTYKIPDKESEASELIDSIVSRISTKNFGTF